MVRRGTSKPRRVLRTLKELAAFVRLIAWSGAVSPEGYKGSVGGRPQSLFMVAEPGSGKTELLERFRCNKQLEFFSDITMRQLLPSLRKARRGDVTHIVVTEFQKVISRRRETAQNFCALILQAMEEGVGRVAFGPYSYDLGGARLGLLAASTVTSMQRHPWIIRELAMDSRMYMVDARSDDHELDMLRRLIADGDTSLLTPVVCRLPEKKVRVHLPPTLAHRVIPWIAEMKKVGSREYGLRSLTRFYRTLLGIAVMHGREWVKRCDLDELYAFRRFWLELPDLDAFAESNMDEPT